MATATLQGSQGGLGAQEFLSFNYTATMNLSHPVASKTWTCTTACCSKQASNPLPSLLPRMSIPNNVTNPKIDRSWAKVKGYITERWYKELLASPNQVFCSFCFGRKRLSSHVSGFPAKDRTCFGKSPMFPFKHATTD